MLLFILLLLVGLLTCIFFIGLLYLFILSRSLTTISPLPETNPDRIIDQEDSPKCDFVIVTSDYSQIPTPYGTTPFESTFGSTPFESSTLESSSIVDSWLSFGSTTRSRVDSAYGSRGTTMLSSFGEVNDDENIVISFKKACSEGIPLDWIKEKAEHIGGKVNKVEVPGAKALQISFVKRRAWKTVLFYIRFDETGGTISKSEKFRREMVQDSFLCIQATLEFVLMTKAPVNIKLMVEVSDDVGSINLAAFLASDASSSKFFRRVHSVCIVDGFTRMPSLASDTRGYVFFDLSIRCANNDLHSGVFGGAVPEAMFDLTWLLAQLSDSKEGTDKLSLSVHGIHGAFSDTGDKTVIPGIVTGKISVRFKRPMTVQEVEKTVNNMVTNKWKKRNSPNLMELRTSLSSDPVHIFIGNESCQSAMKAFRKVTGHTPSTTDESNCPALKLLNQISHGNTAIVVLGGLQRPNYLGLGLDQLMTYLTEVF